MFNCGMIVESPPHVSTPNKRLLVDLGVENFLPRLIVKSPPRSHKNEPNFVMHYVESFRLWSQKSALNYPGGFGSSVKTSPDPSMEFREDIKHLRFTPCQTPEPDLLQPLRTWTQKNALCHPHCDCVVMPITLAGTPIFTGMNAKPSWGFSSLLPGLNNTFNQMTSRRLSKNPPSSIGIPMTSAQRAPSPQALKPDAPFMSGLGWAYRFYGLCHVAEPSYTLRPNRLLQPTVIYSYHQELVLWRHFVIWRLSPSSCSRN